MTDQSNSSVSPVSLQRTVSLAFIHNSGGFAVKAKKGQKDPERGWDPSNNNAKQSEVVLADLENSDANIGIHIHGELVDVDVDTESPYLNAALDALLPPCSHMWGRASKPRSHRIYLLKGLSSSSYDPHDYPFLKRMERIKGRFIGPEPDKFEYPAKVELRGGPPARGEYSLLPGSIHPSGEEYQWADLARARSTPSSIPITTLIRATRIAGAVALMAPLMLEGTRNDMVMALSGFLYRAFSITTGISESLFHLNKDDAELFLKTLLRISGDDPADLYSRMKTFERTWQKGLAGAPIAGAKTIAEMIGDNSIIKSLYTLLTDSPDIEKIDYFTERFAIWEGPGNVIDLERAANGHENPIMSRVGFVNSYGNYHIQTPDGQKLLANLLFTMTSVQRVAGLTFAPGKPLITAQPPKDGDFVNQWTDFEIQPCATPVTDKEVEPFVFYVRAVLANNSEPLFEWVMAWIADIFQDPGRKPGTALVLLGKPGAGKSFLAHYILRPIIGKNHSTSTNNVDDLVKGFNAQFDNKLVINCDEAISSRQKITAQKLLSFITDTTVIIERKGIDAIEKPSLARLIFTSNQLHNPISIEHGTSDRRFTVSEVSEKYHTPDQVPKFWVPMYKWFEDKINLAKVHRWLKDYTYSRDLITRPLSTAAKERVIQTSWTTFDMWLAAMVARNHPLSERAHTILKAVGIINKKGGLDTPRDIDRTFWPDYIYLALVADDYRWFIREFASRYEKPLLEFEIVQRLIQRGLTPTGGHKHRITIESEDPKTQELVKRRVWLRIFPKRYQIIDYLQRTYGTISHLDQTDDFEEGDTDLDLVPQPKREY